MVLQVECHEDFLTSVGDSSGVHLFLVAGVHQGNHVLGVNLLIHLGSVDEGLLEESVHEQIRVPSDRTCEVRVPGEIKGEMMPGAFL